MVTVSQPRRAHDLVAFDDVAVLRPNADHMQEALRSTRRATANMSLVVGQRARELLSSPRVCGEGGVGERYR